MEIYEERKFFARVAEGCTSDLLVCDIFADRFRGVLFLCLKLLRATREEEYTLTREIGYTMIPSRKWRFFSLERVALI